jgi:hypothetical protein
LGKKGKKGQLPGLGSYGRDHMTDKDWEAKFELLLSEDLIDLPDKLREEHLFFDEPDQMFEIFTELEERNLYLIHRKQEIEQAIEAQMYEYRRLQSDLGKTRDLHLANKLELQETIGHDQA